MPRHRVVTRLMRCTEGDVVLADPISKSITEEHVRVLGTCDDSRSFKKLAQKYYDRGELINGRPLQVIDVKSFKPVRIRKAMDEETYYYLAEDVSYYAKEETSD